MQTKRLDPRDRDCQRVFPVVSRGCFLSFFFFLGRLGGAVGMEARLIRLYLIVREDPTEYLHRMEQRIPME